MGIGCGDGELAWVASPVSPGGKDRAKSLGGFRGDSLRLSWLSLGGFGVATPCGGRWLVRRNGGC